LWSILSSLFFRSRILLPPKPKQQHQQPTTNNQNSYHRVALTLLKAAYRRAEALVAARRPAIRRLADELLKAENERVSGARVVEIIESTPLEEHNINIDSDFLPVVRQVLGKVPGVIAAADGQLRMRRRKRGAGGGGGGDGGKAAEATADSSSTSTSSTGGGALASFASGGGAGRAGDASFRRAAPAPAPAAAADASAPAASTTSTSTSSSGDNDDELVLLDEETLRLVSRAVLGRTDVRDLIGRATSYDAAERVRDILLDPRTLERIKAVRRYVEDTTADYGMGASGDSREGASRGSAPFPPEPLAEDVPQPVYGAVWAPLEGWVRRARRSVVTMDALDLLFTDRQKQLYEADHPQSVGKNVPLPGEEGWVDPAADEGDEGEGGGKGGGGGGGGGGGAADAATTTAAPARRRGYFITS
jgi:cell division protease FtsH